MKELIQALFTAIVTSLYMAVIHKWQAGKRDSWHINYTRCFSLVFKVNLITNAMLAIVLIVIGGIADSSVTALITATIGIPLWVYLHHKAVLKSAPENLQISAEKARTLSWHVLGHSFWVGLVVAFCIAIIRTIG
jgi:hypothetical protein